MPIILAVDDGRADIKNKNIVNQSGKQQRARTDVKKTSPGACGGVELFSVITGGHTRQQRKNPSRHDRQRKGDQNGNPLPKGHGEKTMFGEVRGKLFFDVRKLQRIVGFGNGVQGFARDVPELVAVTVVKTQECDGKYAIGFTDASEQFLIRRQAIIKSTLRVVAE